MLDDKSTGLKFANDRDNILNLVFEEIEHAKNAPKVIEYYKKIVYGNERGYILDTRMAQAVYCVSGKTTLCNTTMKGLEMLGFSFKEVLPPKK
jgi:hypothetical protein